jgi:hypothetical protein
MKATAPPRGRRPTDAIWLRGLDEDDLVKALLVFMDRAVGGPWSEALAAADGATVEGKGIWNPALHPRDHRGRFVRGGGWAGLVRRAIKVRRGRFAEGGFSYHWVDGHSPTRGYMVAPSKATETVVEFARKADQLAIFHLDSQRTIDVVRMAGPPARAAAKR